MSDETKVGIELLKKLVKELVQLGKVTNEELKDGYQWTDLWSIFGEAKDLTFVFTNWKEIKSQFDDLDQQEIKDLVDSLVGELDIKEEEIVDLIEKSVDFAESGYELFLAIKALKK